MMIPEHWAMNRMILNAFLRSSTFQSILLAVYISYWESNVRFKPRFTNAWSEIWVIFTLLEMWIVVASTTSSG